MRFLDQNLEFTRLPGALESFHANADETQLSAFAAAVKQTGGRFVALWGSDERKRNSNAGGYAVHVAFGIAEGLALVTLPMHAENPEYPDLSEIFPAANRLQRTCFDLLGIRARGGDQRPWLRHANWPADYFPLRRDVDGARQFEAHNEDYAFVRVEGDGVHEIPVGPIHAGIIEPGHFRFSIVGEKVLRLEQRLGWTHKGIEKRFEQLPLAEAHKLAGRVSGDSTVAFAWAYCLAAESLAACTPPPRALWLRALLLERERVANHLGDLGALGNDAALSFGLAQFLRLKEDWLRLSGELFGHRFMMDAIVPGGVARDLPGGASEKIARQCNAIEREVRILKNIYDEHAGLQDRFLTTGRLNPALASALSISGLAGRASSQAWDLRTQFPITPYDQLDVRIATHRNGDVAARVTLRFEEVFESLRLTRIILTQLLENKSTEYFAPLPAAPDGAFGLGWIEGWRGDVLVALEAGPAGSIRRCHCHDSSTRTWPALEHAVMGNIVPDFPLINKSFNLSYSGQDL
ncbi:MAG: NADH-quinone oxidoreductase subunit C [Betaproteobacteria bacterium]|nr:NADH-quinone oxidoreductase subunit C [Betaproteobacteria bacterium]